VTPFMTIPMRRTPVSWKTFATARKIARGAAGV